MKKVVLIVALMLGLAVAASAQPRAIGLRLGPWSSELSYQHGIGSNFLEADLGLWYAGGLDVALAYDFNVAPVGPFNFYVGPAAEFQLYNYVNSEGNNALATNVGIGAQLGLEYTFSEIPLQLSLDWRPLATFIGGFGFGWQGVAFGIRYTL